MIVCYAEGGGLGHLTRIRAYLHTVHGDEPATILSASPFTADPRILGPHRVLPAAYLPELRPTTLVVDAFPAGLHGELRASSVPPGARVVHLARLLRWDAYRRILPPDPPRFDEVWQLEPLSEPHAVALGQASPLDLADPPVVWGDTPGSAPVSPTLAAGVADGSWLIVHSGPASEIHELVRYAGDCAAAEGCRPRLVLVAPQRPAGLPSDVEHVDPYPAWPLFAVAGRVVSAAGFNIVRQMSPWRSKHLMLPFPRRFDDQFTRAARARQAA